MMTNILVMIDEAKASYEREQLLSDELTSLLESENYNAFNIHREWADANDCVKVERINAVVHTFLTLHPTSRVILVSVEEKEEENTIVTKEDRVYSFKTSFRDIDEIKRQLDLYISSESVSKRRVNSEQRNSIASLLAGRYTALHST